MEAGIIKSVTPQMFKGVHHMWQNKFTGKPNCMSSNQMHNLNFNSDTGRY
jgi:hypothetical protein